MTLYGRPRPVHLASMLGRNTITPHPAGDHKGPHRPTSAALAPTDVDAYLATARIAPPLHQQDTQSYRVRAGLAPALAAASDMLTNQTYQSKTPGYNATESDSHAGTPQAQT